MFKLDLEKAGEPEIKLSTPIGSQKRQNKMNYGGKKKETTQEGHPKEKINFIFQEIEEKTAKAVIEN